MLNKRKLVKWGGMAFVVLAAALTAVHLRYQNPEGQFHVKKIASEGDAYYQFENGAVSCVVPHSRDQDAQVSASSVGKYYKEDGVWYLLQPTGERFVVKASFLNLRIYESNKVIMGPLPRFHFKR